MDHLADQLSGLIIAGSQSQVPLESVHVDAKIHDFCAEVTVSVP